MKSYEPFAPETPYEDRCFRWASDDPYRETRYGLLTLRVYRSHNRPDVHRFEVQPWMDPTRQYWMYLWEGQLSGAFKDLDECKAALKLAAGVEVL